MLAKNLSDSSVLNEFNLKYDPIQFCDKGEVPKLVPQRFGLNIEGLATVGLNRLAAGWTPDRSQESAIDRWEVSWCPGSTRWMS